MDDTEKRLAELEKRLADIEKSFKQIELLMKRAEYDKHFAGLEKSIADMEKGIKQIETAIKQVDVEKKIEQQYETLQSKLSPQEFAKLGLTPPHQFFGREEPPQQPNQTQQRPQEPTYQDPYHNWPTEKSPEPDQKVLQRDKSNQPVKIQFDTLDQAMQHAKQQGGYIFDGTVKGEKMVIWFDKAHYNDKYRAWGDLNPDSGFIGTRGDHKNREMDEVYRQAAEVRKQKDALEQQRNQDREDQSRLR